MVWITNACRICLNNTDVKAMLVEDRLAGEIDAIKKNVEAIAPGNYVSVGGPLPGYTDYEAFIDGCPQAEPDMPVDPDDTYILMYTSGTTSRPKGIVRSHASHIAFYLINANAPDMGFSARTIA